MFLTIFTPTYNSANTLAPLYMSLCAQTILDFEWLVIDDGSVDNTKDLIQTFINENRILIKYYYKNNGGMHTAINLGVSRARGEFVLKVDSDDMLTINAVERIQYYSRSTLYKSKEKELSGITFLNMGSNGKIIGDKFHNDFFISNYITERVYKRNRGDKSEVHVTEKFREVLPIPEFENEKRLPTSAIWLKLAKRYNMLFVNEAIYIRDYRSYGMTNNIMKYIYQSPLGMMYCENERMTNDFKFLIRLRSAINYGAYGLISRRNIMEFVRASNSPLLVMICLPICFAKFAQLAKRFRRCIKG